MTCQGHLYFGSVLGVLLQTFVASRLRGYRLMRRVGQTDFTENTLDVFEGVLFWWWYRWDFGFCLEFIAQKLVTTERPQRLFVFVVIVAESERKKKQTSFVVLFSPEHKFKHGGGVMETQRFFLIITLNLLAKYELF